MSKDKTESVKNDNDTEIIPDEIKKLLEEKLRVSLKKVF